MTPTPTRAQRCVLAKMEEGRRIFRKRYKLSRRRWSAFYDFENSRGVDDLVNPRTLRALLRRGWIEQLDPLSSSAWEARVFSITPAGRRALGRP